MKITNNSPKGKWIHIKISGYAYKRWVAGYDSINLPEVTDRSQLHLNAHERAVIHAEAHGEIIPVEHDPKEFYYTIQASSGAHGTTSLSGASVSVAEGMNLSFSVYPATGYQLSTYTINGSSQSIVTASATTVYTLSNITQDKNIYVAFSTI